MYNGEPAARLLTEEDVPRAVKLSTEAGWNQTDQDWRTLLELAPQACFGIDFDGVLASTTTLVTYGPRLAWLGMVLTGTEYRRRGFAKTLVRRALSYGDAQGIESIKLDATDSGAPLYESLGFRVEQPVERWSRKSQADPVAAKLPDSPSREQRSGPLESAIALDTVAYRADRSRLLRSLAAKGSARVVNGGFVLHRPGSRATYLGPCLATDPGTAERLTRGSVEGSPFEDWFWDILPSNGGAVEIARKFGFEPVRRLVRMVRGSPMTSEGHLVYGAAGFEYG